MKLAKLEKKAPIAPPVTTINVSTNALTGGRVVSFELPQYQALTENERLLVETREGKSAVAQCDATGELIFNEKNCVEIKMQDKERKDIDGVTFSYRFMKQLLKALNPVMEGKLK